MVAEAAGVDSVSTSEASYSPKLAVEISSVGKDGAWGNLKLWTALSISFWLIGTGLNCLMLLTYKSEIKLFLLTEDESNLLDELYCFS